MRRMDGSEDFVNKLWADYEAGFGQLTGEFWIGMDQSRDIEWYAILHNNKAVHRDWK